MPLKLPYRYKCFRCRSDYEVDAPGEQDWRIFTTQNFPIPGTLRDMSFSFLLPGPYCPHCGDPAWTYNQHTEYMYQVRKGYIDLLGEKAWRDLNNTLAEIELVRSPQE